jgi:hypothetical protein
MTCDKILTDKPSPPFHPDAQSKRLERGASQAEAKKLTKIFWSYLYR